ncbi:kinase-like domain-containing protein [Amylostereum chailletii]|nr:kinase-like domain-containing protein [Amylostereum chailletii]
MSSSTSDAASTSSSRFERRKIIGEGAYSTVYLVTSKATEMEYAIKAMDKVHLRRKKKVEVAYAERDALLRLGSSHPGIAACHEYFQDDDTIYFVLDYASNGDLHSWIFRLGSLSTDCSRYYGAQLIDAVSFLHSKNVIHRDLKPENLLLDGEMRLKITDFGTSAICQPGECARGFVGTAHYQPPELILSNEMTYASDLWSCGCTLYQMLAGHFAFAAPTDYLTWQKIKAANYTFPPAFPTAAQDLISRLLVLDPTTRLGAGGPGSGNTPDKLKGHAFFDGVEWERLWSLRAPPMEAGLVRKEAGEENGVGWADDGMDWADM